MREAASMAAFLLRQELGPPGKIASLLREFRSQGGPLLAGNIVNPGFGGFPKMDIPAVDTFYRQGEVRQILEFDSFSIQPRLQRRAGLGALDQNVRHQRSPDKLSKSVVCRSDRSSAMRRLMKSRSTSERLVRSKRM